MLPSVVDGGICILLVVVCGPWLEGHRYLPPPEGGDCGLHGRYTPLWERSHGRDCRATVCCAQFGVESCAVAGHGDVVWLLGAGVPSRADRCGRGASCDDAILFVGIYLFYSSCVLFAHVVVAGGQMPDCHGGYGVVLRNQYLLTL